MGPDLTSDKRTDGPHPPAAARRLTWLAVLAAVLRVIVATTAEVAVFYLLPLDPDQHVAPLALAAMALAAFTVILGLQVMAITRSPHPGVRAVEALVATVPLFVLIFAAVYFVMSASSPADFTEALTRTDAIYFTTTVFSTTGFGDIAAVSETARVVVTAQMLLDLLILGIGVKVIAGAVRIGRERSGQRVAPEDIA